MPGPSRAVDVATSWTASVFRLGLGLFAHHAGPRPEGTLKLFEFEACPFCRKVREALTALDLEVEVYPCPKNGPTYRPEVVERGGQSMFPYLIDEGAGWAGYESADIVRHLYERYGNRKAPLYLTSDVSVPFGSLASAFRLRHGGRYRAARKPEQLLELYSFDSSPYCRIAREALCELELPYRLINVGKGSARRKAFRERSGRMMVPWLSDPNTGVEMFESADIRNYLYETYAA